jgi:aryl-alcohol dehydrogenase-like predicted oxidoreductase
VRILTKVDVQDAAPAAQRATIRESLEESLRVMRLDRVDLLLHHDYLRPPRLAYHDPTLALDQFRKTVRPEFEALRDEGLIGGWGLTATGYPEAVFEVLNEEPRPSVVQAVANALDSPGSLWPWPEEATDSGGTRARAAAQEIGVMGIRALQAGALTDALDRAPAVDDPDLRDFGRAVGLRELAARRGEPTAVLAYRYALTMRDVHTVVLGVKNRAELADALAAEEAGPLNAEEMLQTAAAVGRPGARDFLGIDEV